MVEATPQDLGSVKKSERKIEDKPLFPQKTEQKKI